MFSRLSSGILRVPRHALKADLQLSMNFGFATNSDDRATPAVAQIAGIANARSNIGFGHIKTIIGSRRKSATGWNCKQVGGQLWVMNQPSAPFHANRLLKKDFPPSNAHYMLIG